MNNTHASNMKAAEISEDVCHKRRLIKLFWKTFLETEQGSVN